MIVVDDLHKRHGGVEVLRGVSLEVGRGEVAAILGPSGGGKSTFLRCLNGLERFDRGVVRVADHELTPATDERRDAALLQAVRRRVGFVFQQFHLFPHRTVLGNLVEAPVHAFGEAPEVAAARARELLDRVGLAHRQDAWPRDLSGGQQQRVAIARALMTRPDVVLFDEPTSALDPVMSNEVLEVVTDLARQGQTMVVVTHALGFARAVATRVHVFAEGRDVEHGPPEQVFEDPRHEVTRAFLRHAAR